jgi:predicted small lipoprotein YifL
MRTIAFILAALMFATLIAACGQKGALKLPQDAPAPPAKVTPPENVK